MSSVFNPNTRKNDIVVQELKGETLVYDLNTNKAFCLNETSALVWKLANGKLTPFQISIEMSKRLKTLISEDFVMLALDQLNSEGLLESSSGLKDYFSGLSRRELITKVGFASVVAMPFISSLIAPKSSGAQSMAGLGFGAPCTNDAQCASTNCPTPFPGGPPQVCCAAGAQFNRSAGDVAACDNTAGACMARGNLCCSGSASLSAVVGICAPRGPGFFECRCN